MPLTSRRRRFPPTGWRPRLLWLGLGGWERWEGEVEDIDVGRSEKKKKKKKLRQWRDVINWRNNWRWKWPAGDKKHAGFAVSGRSLNSQFDDASVSFEWIGKKKKKKEKKTLPRMKAGEVFCVLRCLTLHVAHYNVMSAGEVLQGILGYASQTMDYFLFFCS